MSHPNTAQLYLKLDLEQTPPVVVDVCTGFNISSSLEFGIAILTEAESRNRSESMRALCGIITTDPKFAWVREWPDIKHFINQWSKA